MRPFLPGGSQALGLFLLLTGGLLGEEGELLAGQ
jgi:hypothetical protein